MSQYDLAVKAGLGLNRYWRIEKGYVLPKADECARIAAALGCEAAELFPEIFASEAVV